MTTFVNTVAYADNASELRTRGWIREVKAQLTAAGFVQTADTGQLNPDVYPTAWVGPAADSTTGQWTSSAQPGTLYSSLYDGNTAVGFTFLTSSIGTATPIEVVFDAGPSTTNTAATYKIWFQNTTADLNGWKFQGSNDLNTWTTLDTQSAVLPGASGYQTYTIGSPGAYRAYRLYVTSGRSTACTLMEWQILNSGPTNFATPTLLNTFATNTVASYGYQIWRFNDTLQGTAPCFFRLDFGQQTVSADTAKAPDVKITLGNSSNGTGTIGGTGVLSTMWTNGGAASWGPTSNFKNAYSYATNGSRFAMALGWNFSSGCTYLLVLERLKDSSGADTGTGVACVAIKSQNGGLFQGVCMCNGTASPTLEQQPGCLMSSQNNMNRGGVIGIGEWVPFIYARQNAMLGLVAYKVADITGNTSFPATVYGGTHYYFPFGSLWAANINRGITSSGDGIAMLFE